MKKSYYGGFASFLLAFHAMVCGISWLTNFPYFRTTFYPFFLMLAIFSAAVGAFGRDKNKIPAIIAGIISVALVAHWVVMLVMRLKG